MHPDVAAIPGTSRITHLETNLDAADVVLNADALARLDAAAPVGATAGDRYPDISTMHN